MSGEKNSEQISKQTVDLKSGNEMAALAAAHINYHLMGYYPITPSTEVAEELDRLYSIGEHTVKMVPADGEHGAAGICFGASTGGGRVFNATSANGLLYALEQLPVQSGCRMPMVLNVVNRSVSGPLNIRCDHGDVMMALNTGWLIFMAKDPQMVYDMNIIALKVAEAADVRLPAIVSFDGFFTSHQKRRISYFADKKVVQDFVGENEVPYTSLDPRNPLTIGPYMNDPDLINNKKQLVMAMDKAKTIIPQVMKEYEKISGRRFEMVTGYNSDDADVILVLLNSAADTGVEAVKKMRAEGKKVGLAHLNVIRPFPHDEVVATLQNAKVVIVADRQDSYGADGGNMSMEIKASLKNIQGNGSLVLSRVYGLGGKEFFVSDAEELLTQGLDALDNPGDVVMFDYFGATPGEKGYQQELVAKPITLEEASPSIIKVTGESGNITVKGVNLRELTKMPNRISAGHGACPGCGIFTNVGQFLKGIEGYVVVLFHTGCGMVVTTGYPVTSHNVTYIHNLFQSGAATMSGVVEMYHEKQRRGEIPVDEEITFIMVSGDGGMDIGMGPAIGAALKAHRMIILEYDNQGYMNTGCQLSFSTPYGHMTTTSHVGPKQFGKGSHHKDTLQIMAACHLPYLFTATEANPRDLIQKAAKAQYYAKEGLVYGKLFSACPLNWGIQDHAGPEVIQAGVDSTFFPLYEVEHGVTKISYNPETKNKKIPLSDWLKLMRKSKHLVKPEYKKVLDDAQKEVDRRWMRLKAMHEHPLL